jgi:hypothetical protein
MAKRERVQDVIQSPSIISPISRPRDSFIVPAAQAPVIQGGIDATGALANAAEAVEVVLGKQIAANQDAELQRAKAFGASDKNIAAIEKALAGLPKDADGVQRLKALEDVLAKSGLGSPTAKLQAKDALGRQVARMAFLDIADRVNQGVYAGVEGDGEVRLRDDIEAAMSSALEKGALQSKTSRAAFEIQAGVMVNAMTTLNSQKEAVSVRRAREDLVVGDLVIGTGTTKGFHGLATAPSGPELNQVRKDINALFKEHVVGFGLDPHGILARSIQTTYAELGSVDEKEQFLARLRATKVNGTAFDADMGRVSEPVLKAMAAMEDRLESDRDTERDELDQARQRNSIRLKSRLSSVAAEAARGVSPGDRVQAAEDAVNNLYDSMEQSDLAGLELEELNNLKRAAIDTAVISVTQTESALDKTIDDSILSAIKSDLAAGDETSAAQKAGALNTQTARDAFNRLLNESGGVSAVSDSSFRQLGSDVSSEVKSLQDAGLGEDAALLGQEYLALQSKVVDISDKDEAMRVRDEGIRSLYAKITEMSAKTNEQLPKLEALKSRANNPLNSVEDRNAALTEMISLGIGSDDDHFLAQRGIATASEQAERATEYARTQAIRHIEDAFHTSQRFIEGEGLTEGESLSDGQKEGLRREMERRGRAWVDAQIVEQGLSTPSQIRGLIGEASRSFALDVARESYPDAIGALSPEAMKARTYTEAQEALTGASAEPERGKGPMSIQASNAAREALRASGRPLDTHPRFGPVVTAVEEVSASLRPPSDMPALLSGHILSVPDEENRRAMTSFALLSSPQSISADLKTIDLDYLSTRNTGAAGFQINELAKINPELQKVSDYLATIDKSTEAQSRSFRFKGFALSVKREANSQGLGLLTIKVKSKIPDDLSVGPALLLPPSVDLKAIPISRKRSLLGAPASASDSEVEATFRQARERGAYLLDQ